MLWKQRRAPSPFGSPGRGGLRPSPGLAELLEVARRIPPSRVLDLGPVDESTLQVLGEHHLAVQVGAFEPEGAGGSTVPHYDEGAFAGILAWDFLVRLRAEQRPKLARDLARWLAPGGALLVILPIPSRREARSYRFRVRGPTELEYVPVGAIDPSTVPTIRQMLAMFSSLTCNGARILRHGAQEFVFRRPTDEA